MGRGGLRPPRPPNMVEGRQTLVTEITAIVNHIARLDRADPIRATEELALVTVRRRERRRSGVPLGEGPSTSWRPQEALWPVQHRQAHQELLVTHAVALHRRPHPTLSLGRLAPREDQVILPHLSLGPQGPRGDVSRKDRHRGPQGPRVAHVARPSSTRWT